MNENLKKQISDIEDLSEIAHIYSMSTQLREKISEYQKEPNSPLFALYSGNPGIDFKKKGETIYLLGDFTGEDKDNSNIIEVVLDLFDKRLISSVNTLENGLFVGLIESCAINKLGFDITSVSEIDEKEFLFNENNPALLVTVSSKNENAFVDFIYNNGIEITLLGHVTKGELRMDDISFHFISHYID